MGAEFESDSESEAETESASEAATADAKRVGRGAVLLTITKFWFLVTSYVIVSGISKIFGDDEQGVVDFGNYRTVTTLAAIINAFVVVGTQQAVSRFVGRDPAGADGVRRAAYRLQALLGGGIFLVMFLAAPLLAETIYGDPGLARPLRLASFITLFYAFYSVFMGYLNGRKLFGRQALVDFFYATAKCVLILGFASLLGAEMGSVAAPVAGFAAAAFGALALAAFLSGRARGAGEISARELFRFQTFTMGFAGLSSFVLQFDLHVLKILGPGGARGEYLAGLYGAAQPFSQIPFQAVFAITFVLFPLVSGVAERDRDRLRAYILETTRYAAIIATGIVALFFACPERTINVLFGGRFAEGALVLRWLAAGYLAYAPFYVLCSVLNAAGRPRVSLGLIAGVAFVQVALGALLVGSFEALGVAAGTCLAMIGGLFAAQIVFRKLYGQGLNLSVFARTLVAGGITGVAAHALFARHTWLGGAGWFASWGGEPAALTSRLVTVAGFAMLGLLYLVLLAALRVLNADDRARFGQVLKRG
jgi:O-antigen/teichoic acid export membrane protein